MMGYLYKAHAPVYLIINCIILHVTSYRTLPNRTFGVEFELTIPILPNLYTEQDLCDIMSQKSNLDRGPV